MTDVKRLLAEATPLPWRAQEGGEVVASNGRVRADIYGDSEAQMDADAALIVHAVNHLPDYEAAVDALERMVAFDSDPGELDALTEARMVLGRLRPEVPA